MNSPTTPAVVFDVGGVLVTDQPSANQLAHTLEWPGDPAAALAAFWRHRPAYDLGKSPRDYWDAIANDLGIPYPSDATVAALTAHDEQRWARLNPASASLIAELHDRGVPLAILSNAPRPLAAALRSNPLFDGFVSCKFSSETTYLKPQPEAYLDLAETLLTLGHTVAAFFDDRPGNVTAALAAGIPGVLWSDAPAARSHLTSLALLA